MLMLTLALLGVAAPAQDGATTVAPPTAADPNQRVKCRTQTETGSLAKRTRTCRTVAEWRRADDEQRERAYRAADQGAIISDSSRGG